MKIIETLTNQQKIDMLSGEIVGFFPSMIINTDTFFEMLPELCLGYYTYRSGEKIVSPTYEKIKSIVESDENSNMTLDQVLGRLIRNKYLDKWNRVYRALVEEQYNPANDYESTRKRTGKNTDETLYDTTVEDNGNTSTNETITRNISNSDEIYGFNSEVAVPTEDSSEISSETTEAEADKNTTHNKQVKSGTDTNTYNIDETSTITGRNRNASSNIQRELELRNKQTFFDVIYGDIDSIVALSIYL